MTPQARSLLFRWSGGVAVLLLAAAWLSTAPVASAQPADDAYKAGQFDNGKMWTFDFPPIEYLKKTYNFEPDTSWFEQARLSTLRIPGCTASFVSPNGLVMTNHHCGRSHITSVSQDGETLVDDGFYAASLGDERRAPDMYADQLIAIADVTDEVYAALEGMETDAERAEARQAAIDGIEERIAREAGGEEADMHVEVIDLYHGGRYSAYTFLRYTDVRLVLAPELQIGYYGGDPDNFTFPRYNLDISFFRVYDDEGHPLQTDNYFAWSEKGVEEGDAVFVIGNPGSTFRLETVAQLEFRRDAREPAVLNFYSTRAAALQAFVDEHPDDPGVPTKRDLIFSLLNSEKLYKGRVKALNDPMVMARRADTERQLREAIDADADLSARYGDALDRMAQVQQGKRDLGEEFGAFLALTNPNLSSATMRRAILAHRYLKAPGEAQSQLREQLEGIEDLPPSLEEDFLALRLEDFRNYLGADMTRVMGTMDDQSSMAAARRIIEDSALGSAEGTREALESGALSMDDLAVKIAAAFAQSFQDFQSGFDGLGAQEQEIASDLGRARYDIYGATIPPDATFSLRFADGVVKSYDYNGTTSPPYTTFYGLYDHYYSYGKGTEWDLPERWLNPPPSFDLSTPINFVSTADITGGNSGSPVINRDLEIVGIAFDGNIESLSGDFIFLPETNRCVSVDARGILEALDEIYDADRLVLEIKGGPFVPTEEEADAIGGR